MVCQNHRRLETTHMCGRLLCVTLHYFICIAYHKVFLLSMQEEKQNKKPGDLDSLLDP